MEFTYVSVQSDLNNICVIQNLQFFNDSHLKPLYKPKCYEDLIQNRSDAPIFVLEYNDR